MAKNLFIGIVGLVSLVISITIFVFDSRSIQLFAWDIWFSGKIGWNQYTLKVPTKKYLWFKKENKNLYIEDYRGAKHGLIILQAGKFSSEFPEKVVKNLCETIVCSKKLEGTFYVENIKVQSLKFLHYIDMNMEMIKVFYVIEYPSVLIEFDGLESEFPLHENVINSLLKQLILEKKKHDKK